MSTKAVWYITIELPELAIHEGRGDNIFRIPLLKKGSTEVVRSLFSTGLRCCDHFLCKYLTTVHKCLKKLKFVYKVTCYEFINSPYIVLYLKTVNKGIFYLCLGLLKSAINLYVPYMKITKNTITIFQKGLFQVRLRTP